VSGIFAANNADFHELTKKNLRKLAKFAAKVLDVFKKLTPTQSCRKAGNSLFLW